MRARPRLTGSRLGALLLLLLLGTLLLRERRPPGAAGPVNVLLVVVPAGLEDGGLEVTARVSTSEVLPTLLELAGIRSGRALEARSLLRFLAGGAAPASAPPRVLIRRAPGILLAESGGRLPVRARTMDLPRRY